MKNKVVFLLLLIVIFIIVSGSVIIKLLPLFGGLRNMTYDRAKKFYENNNNELVYIVNALEADEHEGIKLSKSEDIMVLCLTYDDVYGVKSERFNVVDLFDEKFISCLNVLYQNGVLNIIKERNTYKISLWSSLDAGKGLLYLPFEQNEDIQGIISMRAVAPNWSYYVDCPDVWLEQR